MIRSVSLGVCVGLALSLFTLGCGSGKSESGSSNPAPWDQARIGNPGTKWWMNATKGKFYISSKLKTSYENDLQGRGLAVSLFKALAENVSSAALPKPEELPGKWIIDTEESDFTAKGAVLATGQAEATDFIDGGADPFFTKSYSAKAFVWANYLEDDASKDAPFKLELTLWEMASAGDAKTLFSDLLNNSLYSNVKNWKTCVATDANNLCP